MSRAYRIAVSESLRRHVKVEDGIRSRLELLAILPAERMAELLADQLQRLGFEREGQVARRVDDDGVEITVDLQQAEVTVRLEAQSEIALQRKASGATYGNQQQAEEQLRRRVRAQLEAEAGEQTEKLREEVTARLEQKLRDLQRELDGAVNRTTAAALKEKARQLGEIEELSEDEETGALTIKVRI